MKTQISVFGQHVCDAVASGGQRVTCVQNSKGTNFFLLLLLKNGIKNFFCLFNYTKPSSYEPNILEHKKCCHCIFNKHFNNHNLRKPGLEQQLGRRQKEKHRLCLYSEPGTMLLGAFLHITSYNPYHSLLFST